MDDRVHDLWIRHLEAQFVNFRNLLVSIFGLTFSAYLAILTNHELASFLANTSPVFLCLPITVWVILGSGAGNAMWAFLAVRIAMKISKITVEIETHAIGDSGQLPLAPEIDIGNIYKWSGASLIGINWLIFALFIGILPLFVK